MLTPLRLSQLAALPALIWHPAGRAMLVASVVGIDPVIPAAVQTQQDYTWRDIEFGQRFVEVYTQLGDGKLTVDYGRLHETEPVGS